MTIKQGIYSAILAFVLVFMVACVKTTITTDAVTTSTNTENIVLSLFNQDVEVIVMGDLAWNSTVELPILSEDGKVFIGWSNEEDLFYGEYTVTESTTLYAVFEAIDEVFSFIVVPSTLDSETHYDTVLINDYTGIAKHLVVPQMINGMYVESIGEDAFRESNVVDIELPIDVSIGYHAFYLLATLKSVTFYGEYSIPYDAVYSQPEMDAVLNGYSNACTIVSGSVEDNGYTYSDGCPVMEVTNIQSLVIAGITYTNYFVIVNPAITPDPMRMSISNFAFEGAENLETLEIPIGESFFSADAFKGCPNITTLIVDDNHPYFELVDGVLFNEDMTRLLYYPSGLSNLSYTIPSTAEVALNAFSENTTLETLMIPEDYSKDFNVIGLSGLKEIIVVGNNPDYQSIDGVLYSNEGLVKYPANKEGSSFDVPSFVTDIMDYALFGNLNLVTLNLTDNVEYIGTQAFAQSQKIQVLEIPSTVWFIESYCFQDAQIQTIILHRSAHVEGSITQTSSNIGRIEVEGFAIYVVDDSYAEYLAASGWSQYSDQIHLLSELPASE